MLSNISASKITLGSLIRLRKVIVDNDNYSYLINLIAVLQFSVASALQSTVVNTL